MPTVPDAPAEPPSAGRLRLWDVVSLIVGIVVGTSIFKAPADIFACLSSPAAAFGVWMLGAAMTFAGALCYAELATTWPRSGGEYEYLTRAFGRGMGFQFAWTQLVAIFTGSLGAIAYVFADYAAEFWGLPEDSKVWTASLAILAITLVNVAGLRAGTAVQNLLTVCKVLGLASVIVAGFLWGDVSRLGESAADNSGAGLGLAMVLVLWSYGGWSHAAYITAEVANVRRNIPRALLLGLGLITLIYLAINAAYVAALGFEGARTTTAPAMDAMRAVSNEWGAKGIGLLVMISALGAINGMILTGARVYAAFGEDYPAFGWLGNRSAERSSPVASLAAQALIAIALVVGVGTVRGQGMIDGLLERLGLPGVAWELYGGFAALVVATAPLFWGFFLLTGLAVFVLRIREPQRDRPFSVPFYPLTPIVFCLSCGYMLYSSVRWAGSLSWFNLLPLLTGLLLFFLCRPAASPSKETS